MNKKIIFVGAITGCLSLNCFGQDCDKYLNKQTNVINTKGIVVKVLGKIVDITAGTNFSKFTGGASDQIQMLDVLQYNTCMQLQTAKNEFVRENLEEKARNTMTEMLKLLTQTGSLTPDVVKILAENGAIEPSSIGGDTTTPVTPQPAPTPPATGDDVATPVMPKTQYVTVVFPCQPFSGSGDGVIRARAMESHSDPQIAKSIAMVVALEELASKIEVTVNSVTEYYVRAVLGDNEETMKDFKRQTKLTVNQTLRGYRTVCEEYRQNTATQKYQCFIALEINEEAALKPIFDGMKSDKQLSRALPNFEKFKKTYDEVMNFYEKTGF
jgi:DNA-binding Lrp family transcriptional regulator